MQAELYLLYCLLLFLHHFKQCDVKHTLHLPVHLDHHDQPLQDYLPL